MKIGFLIPILGIKPYGETYRTILSFLEKQGHQVIHPLTINEGLLNQWTDQARYEFFYQYYSQIGKCDLLLAECSFPCIHVGYEIAKTIQQEKEVIILKAKQAQFSIQQYDPLHNNKNIYIYEYSQHNLIEILKEAIEYNPNQKYKKYNILFTSAMATKLNEVAKKKQIHKSVYIRQLLEKGLASDE